ncbi:MAG: hypothetical protein KY440_03420 [Actinobacteria bacterium]|nr:hypothetical protein [Actinomycetota bacterium]
MTGAQLRFLGAHLTWDLTTDDDPNGERFRAAWQTVQQLDPDDTQELLWQVLAVLADLGRERPDVVVPYIGRLLNELRDDT